MILCKYTRGALEVLGMDVNVPVGDRYRHLYTPPCLHSLSLKCHSVFTFFFNKLFLYFFALSAFSITLSNTSSSSAQSLSFTFTLHYPPVFVVISMPFHFPQRSSCLLATNFLKSPLAISLRNTEAWTAERVMCSGLFHQSRLRMLKESTNVHMLHFKFVDAFQVIHPENSLGLPWA